MPGLAVLVNFLFKPPLQPGFSGERPHQRKTFDRLTQQTGQFTDLGLAAFRGGHHPCSEQADQPDDQRCQQQNGRSELPVEPEHVTKHGQKLENTRKRVVD